MKIFVVVAEIWKSIPGFPGYEASSYGQIRSFHSLNGRGSFTETAHLLVQSPVQDKPYHQVTLAIGGGKYKQMRVHVVITMAFKGTRPSPLHDACHNDGDATNNFEYNLRWDTKKANSADQLQHGTRPLGSQSHLAKLTEVQVAEIKAAIPDWKWGMGLWFAKKFGVSPQAISHVKREENWSHM